jgi:hypothetical protein
MRKLREVAYVAVIALIVATGGVVTLHEGWILGPITICLSFLPLGGLVVGRHSIQSAVPDLVFGGIDTGLLTIPAIWGGLKFGATGALAGAVIGDAITDSIAGFFEGGIARWMRSKGIEESRDPVTTALGKMAGCLAGAGIVLTLYYLIHWALGT